jgi:choline-glycine betaine transporter
MVNKLIQAMILIVIGLALLPVVMEFADNFVAENTGGVYSLVTLLPVIYVIILLTGAVAYIRVGSKQ